MQRRLLDVVAQTKRSSLLISPNRSNETVVASLERAPPIVFAEVYSQRSLDGILHVTGFDFDVF